MQTSTGPSAKVPSSGLHPSAFVAVKGYDTEWATAMVVRYLRPDGVTVRLGTHDGAPTEDTVTALANALEWKDTGTGAHSKRVQRYALMLFAAVGLLSLALLIFN